MSHYYNHDKLPQYYKIGSKYDNQSYSTKNISPDMNFLNRQLLEEDRLAKMKKARQLEEFSAFNQNYQMSRPATYNNQSKSKVNLDNLTGKIGQEKRENPFGNESRNNDIFNRDTFKNPRSHLAHGFNIINNSICGFYDPEQQFPKTSYQANYHPKVNQDLYGPKVPGYQQQLQSKQMQQMIHQQQYQRKPDPQRNQQATVQMQQHQQNEIAERIRQDKEYEEMVKKMKDTRIDDQAQAQVKEKEMMMARNRDREQMQRQMEMERQHYEEQMRQKQMMEQQQPQQAHTDRIGEVEQMRQKQMMEQQQQQSQSTRGGGEGQPMQMTEDEYRAYEEFYQQEQMRERAAQKGRESQPEPQNKRELCNIPQSMLPQQVNPNQSEQGPQINSEEEYKAYMEYVRKMEEMEMMQQQQQHQESKQEQKQIPQEINHSKQIEAQSSQMRQMPQTEEEYYQYLQDQNQAYPQINPHTQIPNSQYDQMESDPEYIKRLKAYEELVQGDQQQQQIAMERAHQSQLQQQHPNDNPNSGPISSNQPLKSPYNPQEPNPYLSLRNQMNDPNSLSSLKAKNIKSNLISNNPYTSKKFELGTSSLSTNPITHPVNSYKFDYNRLQNPLVNVGNNIISK